MEEMGRKRRKIAAEEKLEIFLEIQRGDVTKAEVMRRHGIHSAQLSRIEKKAREALLSGFKNDRRKKDPEKEAESPRVYRRLDCLSPSVFSSPSFPQ